MPRPTTPPPGASAGVLARWGRRERSVLAAMAAAVLGLHLLGWGVLLGAVAPAHLVLGDGTGVGVGLGLTAYLLGARHAVDADHVAAIDGTSRTLVGQGQRPLGVGFWFSLGHSSVVVALCALLAAGVRALGSQVADPASLLQRVAGTTGTVVSAGFLLLLGLVNLVALAALARTWRAVRSGGVDEAELAQRLAVRGVLARLLAPLLRAVRRPRHVYAVGLLFGLGFDTATEVSLLVLAGAGAAVALPWYAVLVLPVLFTAGMTLLDTADGVLMDLAYGWAFTRPARKLGYNIVITGLSVVVALGIGGVEAAGLLADHLGQASGPLRALADVDLGDAGWLVVALFALAWLVALCWWRSARSGRRTSAAVPPRG